MSWSNAGLEPGHSYYSDGVNPVVRATITVSLKDGTAREFYFNRVDATEPAGMDFDPLDASFQSLATHSCN